MAEPMTAPQPTVMVLANCTHASIAAALRKSGHFSKVESAVVYSMPPDRFEPQAQALEAHDFILTIEHGAAFGPLSTKALKERYAGKVVTLPTPFFSGLMPDMAYLRKNNQIARPEGPFGGYHSGLILRECQDGLSQDDVVGRYESGEAFGRLDIRGVWHDSLNELKAREAHTDIALSGYIESRTESDMIGTDFLTMNHPAEGLINHIAQAFLSIAIGAQARIVPLEASEHGLNSGARWPLHPAVAAEMGLHAPAGVTYRIRASAGNEEFSEAEFARRSFEYFCILNAPDSFEIHSPRYIGPRIRH
ncbi:WcbI family polysaccharide biosynthesis putative acetyltransferase [Paracoccaceae bacterium Fryx2]|nr:WcbI family polysaccharide biosynthesis putative acetyltransferase [Paracoccaceae bacterium Fryx2]